LTRSGLPADPVLRFKGRYARPGDHPCDRKVSVKMAVIYLRNTRKSDYMGLHDPTALRAAAPADGGFWRRNDRARFARAADRRQLASFIRAAVPALLIARGSNDSTDCGLLRGSFRPPEEICMLRTLVRDKATLVQFEGCI